MFSQDVSSTRLHHSLSQRIEGPVFLSFVSKSSSWITCHLFPVVSPIFAIGASTFSSSYRCKTHTFINSKFILLEKGQGGVGVPPKSDPTKNNRNSSNKRCVYCHHNIDT